MRDSIVVFINGQRHEVRGPAALLTLSDYLRRQCGLVGTKIVCSEGDCGACTVLVGRPTADGQSLDYQPIDSCIRFMFQLDGTHVVSVEGIAEPGSLNAVQQAMVDCHGSQCGFCTPGFVMTMTGMLQNGGVGDEAAWKHGLTGNLCRCTGYTQILEAGAEAARQSSLTLNERYPAAELLAAISALAGDDVAIAGELADGEHAVTAPATLAAALEFLGEHPDATVAAGATDIGVRVNKTGVLPYRLLDVNRIAELDFVSVDDGVLHCGARASWAAIEEATTEIAPEFHRILNRFGGPQIRAAGTIAGNIANGSPIADSLPFLFVMQAEVETTSAAGTRTIPIDQFYLGYKQLALEPGELITGVQIPLPTAADQLRLYKISRRRDLDISTFTAGIRLRVDAGEITLARVALGGVGPTVVRASAAEAVLVGAPLEEATFRAAGDAAAREVAPISDVRGAAEYRRQLVRNIFVKYFLETAASATAGAL
ncbi:MAG: xanthine dehydrogenase small subunit [Planctomycetaceae bacterium]|nr:xanthine dehydrogenase small subunit [Planctomycetaceae bacterium]